MQQNINSKSYGPIQFIWDPKNIFKNPIFWENWDPFQVHLLQCILIYLHGLQSCQNYNFFFFFSKLRVLLIRRSCNIPFYTWCQCLRGNAFAHLEALETLEKCRGRGAKAFCLKELMLHPNTRWNRVYSGAGFFVFCVFVCLFFFFGGGVEVELFK